MRPHASAGRTPSQHALLLATNCQRRVQRCTQLPVHVVQPALSSAHCSAPALRSAAPHLCKDVVCHLVRGKLRLQRARLRELGVCTARGARVVSTQGHTASVLGPPWTAACLLPTSIRRSVHTQVHLQGSVPHQSLVPTRPPCHPLRVHHHHHLQHGHPCVATPSSRPPHHPPILTIPHLQVLPYTHPYLHALPYTPPPPHTHRHPISPPHTPSAPAGPTHRC